MKSQQWILTGRSNTVIISIRLDLKSKHEKVTYEKQLAQRLIKPPVTHPFYYIHYIYRRPLYLSVWIEELKSVNLSSYSVSQIHQ